MCASSVEDREKLADLLKESRESLDKMKHYMFALASGSIVLVASSVITKDLVGMKEIGELRLALMWFSIVVVVRFADLVFWSMILPLRPVFRDHKWINRILDTILWGPVGAMLVAFFLGMKQLFDFALINMPLK